MAARPEMPEQKLSEAAEEAVSEAPASSVDIAEASAAHSSEPPAAGLPWAQLWGWLALLLMPVVAVLLVPLIYLAVNGYAPGIVANVTTQPAAEKGGLGAVSLQPPALVPPPLDIEIDPGQPRYSSDLSPLPAEVQVRFARTDLAIADPFDPLMEALARAGAIPYDPKGGPESASWPAETASEKDGVNLRLGDVVLSGQVWGLDVFNAAIFAPGRGFADLGSWRQDLATWKALGRQARLGPDGIVQQQQQQQVQQQALPQQQQQQQQQRAAAEGVRLFATHPDIVMAAAQVALLKADRAGRRSTDFVNGLNDHDSESSSLPLPEELWTFAVLRALQNVGPSLSSIEAVRIWPGDFERAPDPATSETDYADLLLALAPDGFGEAYLRALQYTLAVNLPWPRREGVLTPKWVVPAQGEAAALSATHINPILSTEPRRSYLPVVLALVFFAALIAFNLRRHAPVRLDVAGGAAVGGTLSAVLAYALFVIAQNSRDWVLASPGGVPDAVDAGIYLGWACFLTAIFGGLAGHTAFRFARSKEPWQTSGKDADTPASRVRAYLYSDKPVADLKEDRLNFAPLVRALVGFLDNRGTKPPVVLAINGPWGSGKSSLMSMLANELTKTGRFRIAWFNAWQYQKQEQILAAFLKSVAAELSKVWGPWLMLRLAWARFKDATYTDLLLLFLPVFLIALAVFVPDIAKQLAEGSQEGEAPEANLAGAVEVVLYALGGGGLLAQARKIMPFQFSVKWLFAGSDLSGKLGFLDEFQREFRLYREAVGRDKFLIIVDDLDRCNPDAVVEVLKTVNLIVNGDTGAGKTFYLLGFDERYIVQSVEQEFKDFAELDQRGTGSFGRDYLKKIVTVSLSVPVPSPERLKELANLLGTGAQPDKRSAESKPKGLKAVEAWVTRLGEWLRRPLPLVVLTFLVLGAFVWFGQGDRQPPPKPPAPTLTAEQPAGSGDDGGRTDGAAVGSDVRPVELPAASQGSEAVFAVQLRRLDYLGLALVLAAALGFVLALRRQRVATPEPHDTRKFTEAVEAVAEHLPKNPRDLVRLVNRMRIDYLIQAPQKGLAVKARDVAPTKAKAKGLVGEELSAEESVAMTLLRMSHRDLLDPAKLDGWLRPALEEQPPDKAVEALSQAEGERGDWMRGLKVVLDGVASANAVLTNKDKLARYISVQGHIAAPAKAEANKDQAAAAAPVFTWPRRPPKTARRRSGPIGEPGTGAP